MRRAFFAVLLGVAAALSAFGQSDAYSSLLGMAASASSDEGPDAGALPEPSREGPAPATERRAAPAGPSGAAPAETKPEPKRIAPPRKADASREDGEGELAVLAAPAPGRASWRAWTASFASLLPAPTRSTSSYEAALTTAALRGQALGLAELVAASTAR